MRGIEKVDCQGSIAAFRHNILKALTKRRFRKRVAHAQKPEIPLAVIETSVSPIRLRCLSFNPLYPLSPQSNQPFFNKSFKSFLTLRDRVGVAK